MVPLPTRRSLSAAALGAALACCGGGGGSSGGGATDPTPVTGVAGCAVEAVANEGWLHVAEGSNITYAHNPPASGQHYPVWTRYIEFDGAVPRGYWVHNLEHGAIVFAYRPDAPAATIAALQQAYRTLPNDSACGHTRSLLTPDPLLPGPTAVIAADFVLQAGCTDPGAIQAFVAARRGHGPEGVCAAGTR